MPYDEKAADWLASEGFLHPPAQACNHLPTFAEIERASKSLDISPDAPLLVDCVENKHLLKLRGDLVLELRLLRLLSESTGQLWVYPDCGSPAIVVDPATVPETVAAAWLQSLHTSDPWSVFLGRLGDV